MRYRLTLLAWMSILAIPGCLYHGMYPNGYYNGGPSVVTPPQWGYPGGSGTQPFYQPAQPYYQPAQPGAPVFQPGGGTSPTPLNGTTPSTPGSTPNTYGNDGGFSAPTFDPNKVPDPEDTNDSRSPTSQNPLAPTTQSSFQQPGEMNYSQADQDSQPREPRNFQQDDLVEVEAPFSRPTVRQASGNDDDVQQTNRTELSADERPRVYGNDPDFTWVKGVVEYDEQSKTWLIMYNDNPQPSDKLGGELTLGRHTSLKNLRSGDAVRIEGDLDQSTQDSLGKPVFQIRRLKKL